MMVLPALLSEPWRVIIYFQADSMTPERPHRDMAVRHWRQLPFSFATAANKSTTDRSRCLEKS